MPITVRHHSPSFSEVVKRKADGSFKSLIVEKDNDRWHIYNPDTGGSHGYTPSKAAGVTKAKKILSRKKRRR